MAYKRPAVKYKASQESEFRMRTLEILSNSPIALSSEEIKNQDMVLQPLTVQKMSRVLSYLAEMGFVQKSKSKSTGRMVYKATSVMEEQGYEIH